MAGLLPVIDIQNQDNLPNSTSTFRADRLPLANKSSNQSTTKVIMTESLRANGRMVAGLALSKIHASVDEVFRILPSIINRMVSKASW
jgi:hypothetical protein